MRVFLDTEFDGFGGKLISLALVAEDGHEFYGVHSIPASPHPWVAEHVLPVLPIDGHSGLPKTEEEFMQDFSLFIWRYPGCEVVADWPADFSHFCDLLTFRGEADGFRIPLECTMRLLRGGPEISPEIPHNALSDARALRDWHRDWGKYHENR